MDQRSDGGADEAVDVKAFIEKFGLTGHAAEWLEENPDSLDDFLGEFGSFKEFVQETCCEEGLWDPEVGYLGPGAVEQSLPYIDWGKAVYDLACSGRYTWHETDRGTVVVFAIN